ncbi:MAG: glycosyltransferase [Deltaproteobacteria bacterium]|nr:glycosyltransferase [Deltaproteobacteria bacterium]
MDYLEHNLNALAQRQPELARRLAATPPDPAAVVEPARSGAPGLRLGKARLTSRVDPEAEGREQAAAAPPGPLAGLGFALAYHLEPLVGRDLVVYEPNPGLLRVALGARDLSHLLGNLTLAVELAELGDLAGRALFIHRPTARLHPLEAEGLARRLAEPVAAPAREAQPRVFVIPPLLGGSLPVAYWCMEALTALGCRVHSVPNEKIFPLFDLVRKTPLPLERQDRVRAPLVRFLSELAVLEAEVFQPHLCLALAQAPLDRQAIRDLASLGAITAFWFIEDYRLMTYFQEVAASYDYFFHIQGEELEAELNRLGANHYYLPVAAHPPLHRPLALSPAERAAYGAPVGFMGCGYPNRKRFFSELVQEGFPLGVWGTDWPREGPLAAAWAEPRRRLDSGEVVKVYNACDIVLNLHSSVEATLEVGRADFVNPRTLEVPACGGFQLVDQVPQLGRFLEPGREVAVYTNRRELKETALHFLAHPGERAEMAQAARRKVLDRHTYYHRMERLLTRCLGPAPARRETAAGPGPAGAVLAALGAPEA